MPDSRTLIDTVAKRYTGCPTRALRFPVLDGVRPTINHYARKPGGPPKARVDLALGGITVTESDDGSTLLTLFRNDGLLSRPVSATGFGDLKAGDPLASYVSAQIRPSEIQIFVGEEPLDIATQRPAEHFARVLLTFYSNK